jgi:hypothetical protein
VDGTKVGGVACLSNYPQLVTEANMPAALFSNADDGGGDLRASSDSAGATQIALEVVSFSTGGSTGQLYVQVPSVCPTTGATFWIWSQKGAGLSQPAANAAFGSQAVWDSNHKLASHMEATNPTDSTSNANNGTGTTVTSVAGQIGNAVSTPGTASTGVNFGPAADWPAPRPAPWN